MIRGLNAIARGTLREPGAVFGKGWAPVAFELYMEPGIGFGVVLVCRKLRELSALQFRLAIGYLVPLYMEAVGFSEKFMKNLTRDAQQRFGQHH